MDAVHVSAPVAFVPPARVRARFSRLMARDPVAKPSACAKRKATEKCAEETRLREPLRESTMGCGRPRACRSSGTWWGRLARCLSRSYVGIRGRRTGQEVQDQSRELGLDMAVVVVKINLTTCLHCGVKASRRRKSWNHLRCGPALFSLCSSWYSLIQVLSLWRDVQ